MRKIGFLHFFVENVKLWRFRVKAGSFLRDELEQMRLKCVQITWSQFVSAIKGCFRCFNPVSCGDEDRALRGFRG